MAPEGWTREIKINGLTAIITIIIILLYCSFIEGLGYYYIISIKNTKVGLEVNLINVID